MKTDGGRYAAIGLQFGVGRLAAVAVDGTGRRLLVWRRSFDPCHAPPGLSIARVARLARAAIAQVRARGASVVGLAVGVPGMVNRAGVVRSAPALAWTDVDFRHGLERALGCPGFPIGIDNAARLAAVAEHRYGSHAGTPYLLYLAGEDAFDVGVVSDGVPLRGSDGYPAELGWLGAEATVSALLGFTAADPRDGAVDDLDLEVAALARRARAGERRVLAALAEAGSRIGYAAGTLVNLFNPQAVLLDGCYLPLAPWIAPAAGRAARSIAATPDHARVPVAVSTLGTEAAALGGAASALAASQSDLREVPG